MRLHIFFQNLFHVFEFTYCKICYFKHKKTWENASCMLLCLNYFFYKLLNLFIVLNYYVQTKLIE